MKEIKGKECWWIAHNGAEVVHFGKLEGGTVTTGQPNLEEFTDEQAWRDRIVALGSTPPPVEE